VGAIMLMLLLPAVPSYPIEISRVSLLPRKLLSIVLSVPLAASYSLEILATKFLHSYVWLGYVTDIVSGLLAVLLPVGVLSSFLNDIKIRRWFIIAAVSWLTCHMLIEAVSWNELHLWEAPTLIDVGMQNYGWILFALGTVTLVLKYIRWPLFITSCGIVVICYLLSWNVFPFLRLLLGDIWSAELYWVLNWISAGVTWIIPHNWGIGG
jgi:hypothetical protein